jgi:SAM-dependent methyltransferase
MPAGYDPRHFEAFVKIEDRHFWFLARNRALSAVVEGIVADLASGYRVLEVGCGDGNTLRMLEQTCVGSRPVGMDLFAEGLLYARRRTDALLVRGRMEQPPFSVRFHLVGLFDVLEHLEDDRAVLKLLRALVEPGGALILTVPAHQKLWSRFDEEAHHCRRYDPASLEARLIEAGFEVEYLTLFMMALYPLARVGRKVSDWLRRARKRRGRPEGSAVANEIRIRPGINGLLAATLSPERHLMKRRWRLPFGTSILAVARIQNHE